MRFEQIRVGTGGSNRGISTVVERSGGQDKDRTVDSNSEAKQRQYRVHLQNQTFLSANMLKKICRFRDSR